MFLNLIAANEEEIVEHGIWGIGNLAADSADNRDKILAKGGLEILVKALSNAVHTSHNTAIMKTACWAIYNFCYDKAESYENQIKNNLCKLLCQIINLGYL